MSSIRNLQIDENGWFAKGVFISNSIFKGEMKIEIFIDDGATVEYAEKCIESYNEIINKSKLDEQLQEKLSKFFFHMYEKYKENGMDSEVEFVVDGYNSGKNLIDYLHNPTLYVYAPQGDGIGYGIECECSWEPENQCLIIIRNDELLYVGPSEGLDAWRNEDEYYCVWND